MNEGYFPESIGEFCSLRDGKELSEVLRGRNLLDVIVEGALGRTAISPRQDGKNKPTADIFLDFIILVIKISQFQIQNISEIQGILGANEFG